MHSHRRTPSLSFARTVLVRPSAYPNTQESFETIRALVANFAPGLPAEVADSTTSDILLIFHQTDGPSSRPLAIELLLAIVLGCTITARRRHLRQATWRRLFRVGEGALEKIGIPTEIERREFVADLETAVNQLSKRPRQVLEIRASWFPVLLTAGEVQAILNRTVDPTATKRAVHHADRRAKAAFEDLCRQYGYDPQRLRRAAKRK